MDPQINPYFESKNSFKKKFTTQKEIQGVSSNFQNQTMAQEAPMSSYQEEYSLKDFCG